MRVGLGLSFESVDASLISPCRESMMSGSEVNALYDSISLGKCYWSIILEREGHEFYSCIARSLEPRLQPLRARDRIGERTRRQRRVRGVSRSRSRKSLLA